MLTASSIARSRLAVVLWASAVLCATLLAICQPAAADEPLVVCGSFDNNVFQPTSTPGVGTSSVCPNPAGSGGLRLGTGLGTVPAGKGAVWQAVAPAGLEIVGATVLGGDLSSIAVNNGGNYGGDFYWQGGDSL